jgi:hypothetical protein
MEENNFNKIQLQKGENKLRIIADIGGFNFKSFTISK